MHKKIILDNRIADNDAAMEEEILNGQNAGEKSDGTENEENNTEQAVTTASVFGKFDSLEQLVSAYNSLEAEFTKRCQRLKVLEEDSFKTINALKDSISAAETGLDTAIENALSDEEFIERRILGDEAIRNKIIAAYLQSMSLRSKTPVLSGGVGKSALTPVFRPRSLKEAKILADKLLQS